jgi:hypothetical protein
VPTLGGRCWALEDWTTAGPVDQSSLATRGDMVGFTSEALAENLDIVGAPHVEVWIASHGEAPVDFCARLIDVQSDSKAVWVADGVQRCRSDVSVEGITRIKIDLGDVAHTFLAGHRLRIDLASSNYPQFDCVGIGKSRSVLHIRSHHPTLVLPVAKL